MMAKFASRGSELELAARFVLLRKRSGKGGRPSRVGGFSEGWSTRGGPGPSSHPAAPPGLGAAIAVCYFAEVPAGRPGVWAAARV